MVLGMGLERLLFRRQRNLSRRSLPSCAGMEPETCACEVEQGKEGKVTEVWAEGSLEGHVRQRQSRDALPAVAARDSNPSTEGNIGCPAAGKDSKRIREVAFESQQGSKVGVAAVIAGCNRACWG